jgi:hypothetical protein
LKTLEYFRTDNMMVERNTQKATRTTSQVTRGKPSRQTRISLALGFAIRVWESRKS